MKAILKFVEPVNGKCIELGEVLIQRFRNSSYFHFKEKLGVIVDDHDERGDVPGWVLVVLMTTGLVTAIWTIAAPRLSIILRNSLDAMNGIR